jgi:hypothetical protein
MSLQSVGKSVLLRRYPRTLQVTYVLVQSAHGLRRYGVYYSYRGQSHYEVQGMDS